MTGDQSSGSPIESLQLEFTARASAEFSWIEFVEKLHLDIKRPPDDDPEGIWRASAVALPVDLRAADARILQVSAAAKKAGPRWSIELGPVPKTDPPTRVQQVSETVGGYPGLLERMAKAWPAAPDLKITFTTILRTELPGKLARPNKVKLESGHAVRIMSGWQFEPPVGSIYGAVTFREKVSLVGQVALPFSADILEAVSQRVLADVKRIVLR